MRSFFIGIGAAMANALPELLGHLGVTGNSTNGVPLAVHYSFKLGAAVFFVAVLWTVFTTKEYPPETNAHDESAGHFRFEPLFLLTGAMAGILVGAARGMLGDHHLTPLHLAFGAAIGGIIALMLSGPEVASAIKQMPVMMKQLAVVQFFTWLGLFCMWMFFGLATAQQIFGATDPKSAAFDAGTAFSGRTFAWDSIVCFAIGAALLLAALTTFGLRETAK